MKNKQTLKILRSFYRVVTPEKFHKVRNKLLLISTFAIIYAYESFIEISFTPIYPFPRVTKNQGLLFLTALRNFCRNAMSGTPRFSKGSLPNFASNNEEIN